MNHSSGFAKFGAMGAAIAALAIIMLPGISFSHPQTPQNAVKPEVPLTEQELTICNSVHNQLDSAVIPDDNHTAAVDLLNGVYCNRADLVHQIGSLSYPATGLMAYACEATRGTIQDQSASEDLGQFKDIYCASAKQSLQNETANIASIASSLGQISEYSSKAAQVSTILQNSTSLADQRPYSAYRELAVAAELITNATSSS